MIYQVPIVTRTGTVIAIIVRCMYMNIGAAAPRSCSAEVHDVQVILKYGRHQITRTVFLPPGSAGPPQARSSYDCVVYVVDIPRNSRQNMHLPVRGLT